MGEWTTLELLRQSRHDWLNEIQLIKANLSMDRVDRAKEVIEAVAARAHSESKLTSMGIDAVAEMVLTFNWHAHHFQLQMEVIGRGQDLSHCETSLFPFLQQLFDRIDQAADKRGDNHVFLTFLLDADRRFITISFSGEWTTGPELDQTWIHKYFPIDAYETKKDGWAFTLQLP